MNSFFALSDIMRIAGIFILFLAIILQTLVVFYKLVQIQVPATTKLFHCVLLLHYFVTCGQLAVVQRLFHYSIIMDPMPWLAFERDILFVVALILLIKDTKWYNLIVCLACGLMIPHVIELLPITPLGTSFYLISLDLILITSTVIQAVVAYQSYPYQMDYLSLKEAFDSLPDGIMIANRKDRIIMYNERMEQFLQALDLPQEQNIHKIWLQISQHPLVEERIRSTQNQIFIRTLGSVWFLTLNVYPEEKIFRYELVAGDVGEEFILMQQLEADTERYREQNLKLKQMIDSVADLAIQSAALRAQIQLHDILGERLSIIHRYIEDQNHDPQFIDGLRQMIQTIPGHLKKSHTTSLEQQDIKNTFKIIGTEVKFNGLWPNDEQTARVFGDIVREACSNAVRHAAAKEIIVNIAEKPPYDHLEIRNDGRIPDNLEFQEGTGLTGIRYRVEQLKGHFSIGRENNWLVLSVSVPRSSNREPVNPQDHSSIF